MEINILQPLSMSDLGQNVLKTKNQAIILGVIIESELNFNNHFKGISESASYQLKNMNWKDDEPIHFFSFALLFSSQIILITKCTSDEPVFMELTVMSLGL